MNKLRHLMSLLLVLVLAVSCQEFFEGGNKSKFVTTHGSIKSILEERGGYSMFLEAVERTGYGRLLGGGGLVTAFAPDDEAFAKFLKSEYGVSAVADAPVDDLRIIIGYHLIQFSYNYADFYAFSMTNTDGQMTGDGACYKYKTYAKDPITLYRDPRSKRDVHLYNREKYLPVFSSKLFKTRKIADPERDYRLLFPDVDWQGADGTLYAGPAAVTEASIPADNGYLNIVSKVLKPAKTIFQTIMDDESGDYDVMKEIIHRMSFFVYDASLTKNYSTTGDSLFYFYHWKAPQKAAEIPELASEWTYHNEQGNVFDRALRYCNTVYLPKDDVLEPYLKDYFDAWGTHEYENWLARIPDNGLYHLMMTHMYGSSDIVLPSELDMNGVYGPNGEHYNISSDQCDVKFCSNGVIYGIDQVLEPAVFKYITWPLFKNPDYTFYSYAFNCKDIYQQTVDENNRFTLFIQRDNELATSSGWTAGKVTTAHGKYDYKKSNTVRNETQVSNLVMSQFVYGDIPDLDEVTATRFYMSKDEDHYFFIDEGTVYDCEKQPITIMNKYEAPNGTIYETDRNFADRVAGIKIYFAAPEANNIVGAYNLLVDAGIVTRQGKLDGSMSIKNCQFILLSDNAVAEGQKSGKIPVLPERPLESDPNYDAKMEYYNQVKAILKSYLEFYIQPQSKNKITNFLLPGLGPEGMTKDGYSYPMASLSPYEHEDDIKYMTISWDPNGDSRVLTCTDMTGYSIPTKSVMDFFLMSDNACMLMLDEAFDFHTCLGYRVDLPENPFPDEDEEAPTE